jgi:hypothetical protein
MVWPCMTCTTRRHRVHKNIRIQLLCNHILEGIFWQTPPQTLLFNKCPLIVCSKTIAESISYAL